MMTTIKRIPKAFLLLAVIFGMASCRKEFYAPEPPAADRGIVEEARNWFDRALSEPSKGELDFNSLKPDWERVHFNRNNAGQTVLTIPVANRSEEGREYMELAYVSGDRNGMGVVKHYVGDLRGGKAVRLRFYDGQGRLFVQGGYDPKMGGFRPAVPLASKKSKLRKIASTSSSGNSTTEEPLWNPDNSIMIDEVIVYPPNNGCSYCDTWPPGGGGGDGGSSGGGDYGWGGGNGGGGGGGGTGVPVPPGGGWNGGGGNWGGQSGAQDSEPASYYWRNIEDLSQHLQKLEPWFIIENGENVPNPNAYNCHYYTFGLEYAEDTAADDGRPNWVYNVNLKPSAWTRVTGSVQVGDVVIYRRLAPDGNSHGMTHSGKVVEVEASGRATLISSKMGIYEIIEHHPRDVPVSYGSTDPTYSFNGETHQSRLYYRKK